MPSKAIAAPVPTLGPPEGRGPSTRPVQRRTAPTVWRGGGLFHFSGVYALAVLIIVFAIVDSPYFLTSPTLKSILATSAIGGMVAVGAVVPFSTGMLDIQFGNVAGFALVLMTWLSLNSGLNDGVLALITIAASTAFGLASGLIVAYLRVSSLVVTLGMGTLALGCCYLAISARTAEADLSSWFSDIGRKTYGPLPLPVILLALLASLVHVWLEHTASGRRFRLVGSNPEAARMAGIDVARTQTIALTFSSFVAGVAGVIWTAQLGFGNSINGSNLLFPAISAVLLGSTQVRHRINVPGTVLAVLIIQTAVTGFNLHEGGTAAWPANAFSGVLLLAAVSIVAWNGRRQLRLAAQQAAEPSDAANRV